MASNIPIQAAVQDLLLHLAGNPWLTSIGVGREDGQECLFVYVSRLGRVERKTIPSEWNGYRVIARRMNLPRPAHA